jgi:hypothetical protein
VFRIYWTSEIDAAAWCDRCGHTGREVPPHTRWITHALDTSTIPSFCHYLLQDSIEEYRQTWITRYQAVRMRTRTNRRLKAELDFSRFLSTRQFIFRKPIRASIFERCKHREKPTAVNGCSLWRGLPIVSRTALRRCVWTHSRLLFRAWNENAHSLKNLHIHCRQPEPRPRKDGSDGRHTARLSKTSSRFITPVRLAPMPSTAQLSDRRSPIKARDRCLSENRHGW